LSQFTVLLFFFWFGIQSLSVAGVSPGSDVKENYPDFYLSFFQQNQLRVSGTVVSAETREPLAGASVTVRGGSSAVVTDADGKFTISAEAGNVLVITYVGFQSREVTVTTESIGTITLIPVAGNLQEVVINKGYYTETKRLTTGSVSNIGSTVIGNQPVTNPLAALQGRVTGLTITSNSGSPGSSFNVRIRGENSISSQSDPLYIIDGVPFISTSINQFNAGGVGQSPLSSINPNDIESIDVLKDADATAIYGSRGANGVVLITTKRGRSGKGRVNFNIYTGFSNVSRKLNMLNTEQYLALRREAFENDGVVPTEALAPDLFIWDQNQYTDWQDLLIGNTANLLDAQVSFSGGNEQVRFLLSGSYRKENTVVLGDDGYQRGGVLLKVDHSSRSRKFNLSASLNATTDKNRSIPTDVTQYINRAPNYRAYDDEGGLYWLGTESNPLSYLYQTYETKTNSLIANSTLSYAIIPDLLIKTSLGYNHMAMDQYQGLPQISFNPNTTTGSQAQYGTSSVSSYIIEPQINYTRSFGMGELNVLLGASWQESLREGYYLLGTGYSSDAQLRNIGAASSLSRRNNTHALYHYQSVFGRVNYAYDQKYIINATFRRDGSSRFGPNRRFGNFGSVGAAWIFSDEQFMDNVGFLSFGKLRTSYGTSGNDQIGDYAYLDTWSPTTFAYGGVSGLYPTRVYNPEYGWETNRKFELALDLGFLQDKLNLSVGYFNNRSGNQLIGRTLAPQTGFSSFTDNLPAKIENTGWELEINSFNFSTPDFSWNTSFNISVPRNKLLEYPDLETRPEANRFEVGKSLRIVKGYEFLRVNPETGIAEFVDQDNSGTLTEAGDWVVIGDLLPKFFGGLTNDLRYKDWELSFFFQFVNQEAPGIMYGPYASPYGTRANKDITALDRWQKPGDITNIPRATTTTSNVAYTSFNNYYRYSSATWSNASYIRLKNLSLKYNFTKLANRLNLENLTVYAQGQNLFIITDYHGLDPETQGFDRNFVSNVNPFGSVKPPMLPVMRSITFGLRLQL
ncbi:MAG TPA: TonB-dependent receptor, partial [Parasegetibacter sp.]